MTNAFFPSNAAAAASWRHDGRTKARRRAASVRPSVRKLEAELPVDGDRDPALGEVLLVVLRLAEGEVESPGDRWGEVVGRPAPHVQTLGIGFGLRREPGRDKVLLVARDSHREVQVDVVRKLDTPPAPGEADSLARGIGLG